MRGSNYREVRGQPHLRTSRGCSGPGGVTSGFLAACLPLRRTGHQAKTSIWLHVPGLKKQAST